MNRHVDRDARLGQCILISGNWYNSANSRTVPLVFGVGSSPHPRSKTDTASSCIDGCGSPMVYGCITIIGSGVGGSF